ncbi:DUF6799 domain-containing protein [Aestuariivivens sediminis]|uniref:DUF6799 domain-containing protein n=1 Tax=Aestuariivivens sediminis TaxID=2913557 RepID=UPI001F5618DA|nr:DUF6799 domain-containing protein [Aestuariivivens sediminis]
MKKIILWVVLVVFNTTALLPQDKVQERDRDRIMLVDGDVLQIRDRDHIRLKDKITLNDGSIVNPDGTYLTRNGVQLRLKDGECLDNDGIIFLNEYQYRYKIQRENRGLSEAQIQQRNQDRYQIMMIDGAVYQIRNEFQNRIHDPFRLNNGTVVNMDGSYQTKDRKQLQLQDGACLNMNGVMFKNTLQHRKMTINKPLMKNRIHNKSLIKKQLKKKGAV